MLLAYLLLKDDSEVEKRNIFREIEILEDYFLEREIPYFLLERESDFYRIGRIVDYSFVIVRPRWLRSDVLVNIVARANQFDIPVYFGAKDFFKRSNI